MGLVFTVAISGQYKNICIAIILKLGYLDIVKIIVGTGKFMKWLARGALRTGVECASILKLTGWKK